MTAHISNQLSLTNYLLFLILLTQVGQCAAR